MKPLRPFIPRLGASLLWLAAAATAPALTVTLGPSAGPGTVSAFEYRPDYAAWFVGDFTNDPDNPDYIAVIQDAGAGAWTLQLSFPAGSPALQTGDVFAIQELLTIDPGSEAVTGWQQTVLSPDWQWVDGGIFDNDTTLPLPGLSSTVSGSTITFSFDAISGGTNLLGAKNLIYTGPGGAASPFSVQVVLVPEPGAAVLGLAAASLVLLRSRSGLPRP